jgi:hypothetical protein
MKRAFFEPLKAPRPPRRYGARDVQGYGVAVIMFGVAAILLAIALRIATG